MNSRRFAVTALTVVALMLIPLTAFAGADGDFSEYQSKGWVWMFLGAFGFGFLTALTPCVYPMIPIVVGVFGARDENVTRRKAFVLATMYVLGMGLLFATLGLVFALLGSKTGFGTLLAEPGVVIPIVVFYVLLAASMFGFFEMNLPMGLQNRLNRVGGKGYAGAFGLGMVGGLTAAPCTGPFLAGMLAFVATEGNPAAGFGLLFTYALGIGVLFWVIAVFAVSMPKSGRWMEWVKSFGGIALLGAAMYFLRPLLPMKDISAALGAASKTFLIISIAGTAAGLLIGAIHLSFHSPRASHKARKGLGILLTVAGITGIVTAVLTPDRYLPWVHDEQQAFAMAKEQNKGVMVDFSATWCGPCQVLETTFGEDDVYSILVENYIPLKIDVSKQTDADEAIQEKYNAANLPAVIFMGSDRTEYARINEELGGSAFLKVVEPAVEKMKKGGGVKLGAAESP